MKHFNKNDDKAMKIIANQSNKEKADFCHNHIFPAVLHRSNSGGRSESFLFTKEELKEKRVNPRELVKWLKSLGFQVKRLRSLEYELNIWIAW